MSEKSPILVSACLAGLPCRYDAQSKSNSEVMALVAAGLAIPICPEQLGGLPTPRPAAEIVGGDGHAVLTGKARVVNSAGEDVSQQFLWGAQAVAELAQRAGVKMAILQDRSPSCGCTQLYDGTFSGQLLSGQGVTAARLQQLGVLVRPAKSNK